MSVARYLGATRNPMGVRSPAKIAPDATPRAQFHHVNDIVPTIYEILGITPPREVNGVAQDSIDGVGLAYTFDDPAAEGRLETQYFETLGSRGIYHKGWMASTFGPRVPWVTGMLARHLRVDTRQGHVGALQPGRGLEPGQRPRGRAAREAGPDEGPLADRSDKEPTRCRSPEGLDLLFNPENGYSTTLHRVDIVRRHRPRAGDHRPELGTQPSVVTIDAMIPADANGVLYKLGGFAAWITCFMENSVLCYESDLFEIQRTKIHARKRSRPARQRCRSTRASSIPSSCPAAR